LIGFVLYQAGSFWFLVDTHIRRSYAPVCCLTPADAGHEYRDVTFTAVDNVTLSGWYIASQNGAAVILLHGYNGHRAMMLPQAKLLADQGYGVLLYDLRGHSESGGDYRSYGWQDTQDVTAALTFLRRQPEVDGERIGIFGFSVGGQVALRAAVADPAIKAVVADGPGPANNLDFPQPINRYERLLAIVDSLLFRAFTWRSGVAMPPALGNTIDAIAPRPLLLIATGPADDLEQRMTQQYFDQAAEPKSLWLIPEAGHGGAFAAQPKLYAEKLVGFFDGALGK
jgi:uncharacterized protein